MTVVQNVELKPDGTPAKGVRVTIRIGGVPGALSDETASIVAAVTGTTSTNGQWSFDLRPNKQILPIGTWYTVTRVYPVSIGGQTASDYIYVPVSSTPVLFEQIKTSSPSAPRLTDSELTDHLAHEDPHDQYLKKADYTPGGSTGPIDHEDVTDWDSALDATLDARPISSLAPATGPLGMGSQKVTGLAPGTSSYRRCELRPDRWLPESCQSERCRTPTTGTWSRGQLAIDVNERVFKCVTAGTPVLGSRCKQASFVLAPPFHMTAILLFGV